MVSSNLVGLFQIKSEEMEVKEDDTEAEENGMAEDPSETKKMKLDDDMINDPASIVAND